MKQSSLTESKTVKFMVKQLYGLFLIYYIIEKHDNSRG